MKLTTFILLISIMQVSATSFGQSVTISRNRLSVEKIFREIRRQTGYDVLVSSSKIDISRTIRADFNNAPLKSVLDKIVQGTGSGYSITDKSIVISQLEAPSLLDRIVARFTSIEITGHVTDEKDNVLAGATIIWENGKKRTATDADGNFFLDGIDENTEISVSFVGYKTRTLKVKRQMGQIKLELFDANLDAVQIIAYGTNTRRLSVGSSVTVNAEDIEKQPVNNLLLTLQGRVPGLEISASNGAPSSSVRVQVRGQGAIKSDINAQTSSLDQPLFIIDGIPFAPQNNAINLTNAFGARPGRWNSNNTVASDGIGPFGSINPADIESVTILKDADATSIYGSQGSRGVILITTKKGKAGKTRVDAKVEHSLNFVARPLEMLNTEQYLQVRREAIKNDNIPDASIDAFQFPDLTVYDQGKYTDWYKQFFGGTGQNTTANLGLSGGTEATTFLINAGYSANGYNFPGEFADTRYSLHTNLHHSAFNNKLTLDFGTDYAYGLNNTSGNPNLGAAYTLAPNTPDLIDASGNLVWNYRGSWLSSYQQYAYLKQTVALQTNNLNTNVVLGYKIMKGLNFNVNMGYSRFSTDQNLQNPKAAQTPEYPSQSQSTFGESTFQTTIIEPKLDYNISLGKGTLSALLGGSYKRNLMKSSSITGDGYSSDALLGSLNGAANYSLSDDYAIYKYSGVFARLNYVYDNRYIINLTANRNGSSNFGPDRQFGDFGSAGLGWIFSEERGFKELLPFVSYAKLAANYGSSGSDGVTAYRYQAFYQPNTSVGNFQGSRPYDPVNLYNPDYSWSLKKTLNLSIDLGLFQNKLILNATYYRSREGSQLGAYVLPSQTGFSSVIRNFDAEVQNKGMEFTIVSKNINTKNFRWETNFNLSFNRNKLIAFPGLDGSPYASLYTIGQSVNVINGFNFKGLNTQTGIYEFYKANGETTSAPDSRVVSQGGDMTPIANLEPKYSGGLGNTFSYKGFSLFAFLQFSKRTGMNYLGAIYGNQYLPGNIGNIPIQALDHWRNPGDNTPLMRVSTGQDYDLVYTANSFAQSSGAYGDASYIRLKTLSLEYTLPERFTRKMFLKSPRIYARGQNLFTITGYQVGDPETAGSLYVLPLQRTIAFGLSFNL